jgi:phage-related minor tail protein
MSAVDSHASNRTFYRTVVTRNVTENAAGGVRMHADGGYIATGPTYMTPRDLVGEAGAEAIVPLTNRRYTGAFARVIADEISKGGGKANVTANFYVTAQGDPEAFARQSMRAVVRLARSEG